MRVLIASLTIVLLAGCASTSHRYVTDEQYIARAELGARLAGAKLIWVNAPEIPAPDPTPPVQPQPPQPPKS